MFDVPLSSWHEVTVQGPKTSSPTKVKGSSVLSQSAGKSTIFCDLLSSSKFTAGNALVDHDGNASLISDDLQSCHSEVALVLDLLVVVAHKYSGDVVLTRYDERIYLTSVQFDMCYMASNPD